ncbi:SMI1/KNR4 family protein, partial [Capnocytophaga sp.]|uniref:SMI1/KNR4 family protein n=1 Tax=Capnocytophaga sp. TaxID=44737 RepID=UPI0026DD7683
PYVHEPLTEAMVADFETKTGFRPPNSLIVLLKEQNGGYTRYGLSQTPPMQLWGVGERYPCLIDLGKTLDKEVVAHITFPLDGLLAFDGDGHYYFCLDYRKNAEEPTVICIDIQDDSEEVIADNFDEFLKMLVLDTDDLYVLKTQKPLQEAIQIVKNQLDINFEMLDSSDYGYESYKAKFGGHWLFFSPNAVPLAFAREGEHNFDKLKNYAEKTALRFPEIDANCLLINIYNEKIVPTLQEKLNGIFEIERLSDMI